MGRTQELRHIEIATPLGKDCLLLRGFSVTEPLGRPFHISLDLLSAQRDVDPSRIMGQNVTIRLDLRSGGKRFFNGYLSQFRRTHAVDPFAQFQATVVPWIWFLTRTADCRIYQDRAVPDILQQVMRDHGYDDVELRLSRTYRPWEYCVQYRESDLDFMHRLMEQEGMYYYFRHADGKHTLVLADSPSSHEAYPGYEEIPYRAPGDSGAVEHVADWAGEYRVIPGAYAHRDFDFKNPSRDLLTACQIPHDHAGADFEVYDYPGEYDDAERGEQYARTRMETFAGRHELYEGSALARGIAAGHVFRLVDFPLEDQQRRYLVTSATLSARTSAFDSNPDPSGDTFGCSFTAIPDDRPFRLPMETPKPRIAGPQTAIVVGPAGEEVYTDPYGRVKVQFHWDRYGQANEDSSCWVRVAQLWAGKKWGGLFLPRIGQEVIVEFLEGDPDRPIITGRVYNGATMPPYELPGHKTLSTLKSNSSKSGGGFNEIRFEDKKGSEQLFLHAQKDHDLRVGNDCRELVGHNRHLIVRKDQLEQVEGDKHLSVHGDRNEKVDGTISIRAGADVQEKIGGKLGVDSGTEIHLKAGSKVVIEAGAQLTLKGAGGFVEVGPAGVTIEGTMVQINNGASSGSGSGCSPASPEAPDEADSAQPGEVAQRPAPPQPPEPVQYCGQAMVLARAAEDGAPYCARCPTAGRARPDTGAPTEARASAFVGAKGRAEAGVTLRGDPKPPATGDGAAQMMQMQQTDAAAAQTIQTQIAAERQKHEWTKWKILQDTQTKIQEIQPGVSAQKARVHDKMFQKWDKYIRDEE